MDEHDSSTIAAKIPNHADFYAVERVMTIADFRGVKFMSIAMMPCGTLTPPTCWKQAPI